MGALVDYFAPAQKSPRENVLVYVDDFLTIDVFRDAAISYRAALAIYNMVNRMLAVAADVPVL